MLSLIQNIKYGHISMLKKYNKIYHYRFKQADQYVRNHNWVNVQNYNDYCNNLEAIQEIQVTVNQKDEDWAYATMYNEHRKYAWSSKPFFAHTRNDDQRLQYPIQGKTLLGFMKQGLKQRKPYQLLIYCWIAFIGVHMFLYFYWWKGSEDDAYVSNQMGNPEAIQSFSAKLLKSSIQEQKRRIGVQLQQIGYVCK